MLLTSTINPTVQYETLERIGFGGSSVVQSGVRVSDGKPFALKHQKKPMRDSSDYDAEDAVMAAGPLERCAVAVDAVVSEPIHGRSCRGVVMPLILGKSLHDLCPVPDKREGWVPWRAIDDLLIGLGALHDAGFVHCDVKPENMMLPGNGKRSILIDFGLAVAPGVRPEGYSGTPSYSAPEQFALDAITPAADVFAVGMILFERITGQFGRPDARFSTTTNDYHVPADQFLPNTALIHDAHRQFLSRMLHKNPSSRPSIGQCRDYIGDILSGAAVS